MHSLEHSAAITEGQATNVIFDAARANPKRERRDAGSYVVQFSHISGTEYRATVRDRSGLSVAIAVIDEFDI